MSAVAISTTGDPHRLHLLRRCVQNWNDALGAGESLFVTVDGDAEAARRALLAVMEWTGSVFRVGRPQYPGDMDNQHRLGVAANKNTGLELLMESTRTDRFWLSDDDSWPLSSEALDLHYDMPGVGHSLVCWGYHRRSTHGRAVANWQWPRGAVMYVTRPVVDRVGGLIEAFGPGGHEHVEWSRRIHNAGFTPCNYPSPRAYVEDGYMGAKRYWHCEDMPKPGENVSMLLRRRRALTSVRRAPEDDRLQARIMSDMDGSSEFVPYQATLNGRASATLYP